ncbi:hypothetical protein [Ignicoccus hospitalis]|uniref:hypothetical protein n=1 Tax=Ignicoccus hospitalis TaxID=160233 RepID=UPI001EE32A20|nr:hypothetical protein [Ignicoccus hospitalis]
MTAYLRKRKKSSERYRSSCEYLASDGYLLVTRRDACGCEGYGESAGPFVVMKRLETKNSAHVTLISIAFLAALAVAYSKALSSISTITFETAFLGYLGTLLLLAGFQSTLSSLIARLMGASLNVTWVVVPSPLPSLLPLFTAERAFCRRGDFQLAVALPLLASMLLAAILSHTLAFHAYPKGKPQVLESVPLALADAPSGPVQLAALAYALSALFQLTGYPYSPSWPLLGRSNALFPLSVGVALSVDRPVLGELLGGYVLMATLFSAFVRERAQWKDPFSRTSVVALASTLITLFLVVPVG